ncbi:MAG: isoaspartyl peptidase/L-asparaginase [Schleiferiaceae bacterium]|nr:isoaspartyl peptidase/L-asparaginase [Schleiferiaceae bacterium]
MKRRLPWWATAIIVLAIASYSWYQRQPAHAPDFEFEGAAIVIHGGAGVITRENMSPEMEALVRSSLERVLDSGYAALERGENRMDVVVRVLGILESDSLFNAGIGAVVNAEGVAELDASLMDGETKQAGAVAGLRHILHPAALAREVMSHSEHVFMIGEGAETFAQQRGMTLVDNDTFLTHRRHAQYARWAEQHKRGTVGVVLRDREGHLAAGTSTGGMMGKQWGRVGDVPVLGAGTYADDQGAAVSCTGHGEYFIREAVAYQVNARMQFGGLSLADAAHHILFEVLNAEEGQGGLIAIDAQGHAVMEFNSSGMYRGAKGRLKSGSGDVSRYVRIYGEETTEVVLGE